MHKKTNIHTHSTTTCFDHLISVVRKLFTCSNGAIHIDITLIKRGAKVMREGETEIVTVLLQHSALRCTVYMPHSHKHLFFYLAFTHQHIKEQLWIQYLLQGYVGKQTGAARDKSINLPINRWPPPPPERQPTLWKAEYASFSWYHWSADKTLPSQEKHKTEEQRILKPFSGLKST